MNGSMCLASDPLSIPPLATDTSHNDHNGSEETHFKLQQDSTGSESETTGKALPIRIADPQ